VLPYFLALHGDPEKRRRAVRMGVDAQELPGGGWRLMDELCARSGFITPHWNSERSRRARRTGEFSYQRFYGRESPHRELMLGTVPYGSCDDAAKAAPGMLPSIIKDPHFRGAFTMELENAEFAALGVANPVAKERWHTGGPRGPLNAKFVSGVVAQIVLVIAYGEWGDGVAWSEVEEVTQLLAQRVLRVLGEA
jgi:hypothetical protein